jgi:nitroreductase/NAD-dependent dihydropyrimidine dehydrogenase PreA subunit
MKEYVIIDKEKCIGCGLCASDCISRLITLEEGKASIKDFTNCFKCGHCGAVCPVEAITFDDFNYVMDVKDLSAKDYEIESETLINFIKTKRSCRQYENRAVEKEKLDTIIEIGRVSPTGGNRQPVKFIVIDRPEKMEEFKTMIMEVLLEESHKVEGRYKGVFENMLKDYKNIGYDRLFYNAPAIIIVYGNPKQSVSIDVDGGIAAAQMTLAAETLGLGSCYLGFVNLAARYSDKIYKYLNIPEGDKIITNIIFGYPKVQYFRTVPRKKADVRYI